MKVLNAVFSLQKGGTQRAAQNFATGYAANGHDSRLLFTREDGPRRNELLASGILVYDLRSSKDLEALKQWGPDVVHIHSHGLTEQEMEALVPSFPKAKLLETNVFSTPSFWENHLHASFQLSNWCSYLYSLRGGHSDKSYIVPYPVETNNFLPADANAVRSFREQHKLWEGDFVIGRIGQSFDGKWSDVLVDVFEELRQADQHVRLLVVNPPESIRRRIRASRFAKDSRIIESIIGDEALATCYSSVDVFLHIAGQGESFGMVLAESLLCETPVVTLATPWGDNSQGEVIGHGTGGYIAARKDRLAAIVTSLKNDPALRRSLGQAGRRHVIEAYSARSVASLALSCLGCNGDKDRGIVNASEILKCSDGKVSGIDLLLLRNRKSRPFLIFSTGYRPFRDLPATLFSQILNKVVQLGSKLNFYRVDQ